MCVFIFPSVGAVYAISIRECVKTRVDAPLPALFPHMHIMTYSHLWPDWDSIRLPPTCPCTHYVLQVTLSLTHLSTSCVIRSSYFSFSFVDSAFHFSPINLATSWKLAPGFSSITWNQNQNYYTSWGLFTPSAYDCTWESGYHYFLWSYSG